MTNPIATFCASAGVATTLPSAWSLQDLQALVEALIELQAQPCWSCGAEDETAQPDPIHCEDCGGAGYLSTLPCKRCAATGRTIIRAAQGVTLEPGEYETVSGDITVPGGSLGRFTVRFTENAIPSTKDEWGWSPGSTSNWVTAVRRVYTAAAPEPVAAPLVEPGRVELCDEVDCPAHGANECELQQCVNCGCERVAAFCKECAEKMLYSENEALMAQLAQQRRDFNNECSSHQSTTLVLDALRIRCAERLPNEGAEVWFQLEYQRGSDVEIEKFVHKLSDCFQAEYAESGVDIDMPRAVAMIREFAGHASAKAEQAPMQAITEAMTDRWNRIEQEKAQSRPCNKCHGSGSIPNGNDEMACGICTGSGISPMQPSDAELIQTVRAELRSRGCSSFVPTPPGWSALSELERRLGVK